MGKKKGAEEPVAVGDDRGNWSNSAEFLLSCLGYAVGLGNVWRFPYLAYQNGGGAFLIPYAIMLMFVGIPIFFIELGVGQYVGEGPVRAWGAMAPMFQGLGVGMMIMSCISNIYYNMILGWSLYYLFASWQSVLPWSECDKPYNTAYCYSPSEDLAKCSGNDTDAIWFNQTCYNSSYLDTFTEPCVPAAVNCSINILRDDLLNETKNRVSASDEYFNYGVLNRSLSINDTGDFQWKLVLALLAAWVLSYLCVLKGIRSSGKVVYFTATFPFLIIFILLIRGCLLEGALEGIKFYIIPEWDQLKTAKVWVDAAGQIFFSLSVGLGGLMTFSSYNKFRNNVYRDTLIVCIGNCVTSFVAGFAIFSILGHLGHILKKPISEVATSGSGLAFIVYPEVVLFLEPPQLWSSLFFFMLITLGLDSQFAGIENVMSAMVDAWPKLRRYKPVVSGVLCSVWFILGLTMCTQSGVYWLELMSYYSSGWSLVLMAMAEVMVASWCYLARNVKKDIESMLGFRLYGHWWFCWTFISPLLLLGILVFTFIDFTPLTYGDYQLEDWAQNLGWVMAFSSVAMIPLMAIVNIARSYSNNQYKGLTLGKRLLKLTRPSSLWRRNHQKNEEGVRDPAVQDIWITGQDPPPYNGYDNYALENCHTKL